MYESFYVLLIVKYWSLLKGEVMVIITILSTVICMVIMLSTMNFSL